MTQIEAFVTRKQTEGVCKTQTTEQRESKLRRKVTKPNIQILVRKNLFGFSHNGSGHDP